MCKHSPSALTVFGLVLRPNATCRKCGAAIEVKHPVALFVLCFVLYFVMDMQDTFFPYNVTEYYVGYSLLTILILFSPRLLGWKEAEVAPAVCRHEANRPFPFRRKCVKCGEKLRYTFARRFFLVPCILSGVDTILYLRMFFAKIIDYIQHGEVTGMYSFRLFPNESAAALFREVYDKSFVVPPFAALTFLVLSFFCLGLSATWKSESETEKEKEREWEEEVTQAAKKYTNL